MRHGIPFLYTLAEVVRISAILYALAGKEIIMGRTDGYRVTSTDPIYQIVPQVMPHRYDATNYMPIQIDLDPIQDYIKASRVKGVTISHMAVIIAGYLRLVSQNPYLNRFVIKRKIYARNHFCVTFVTLTGETETVNKLYFNLDDTIFTVEKKIEEAIERSRTTENANSVDKVAGFLCKAPWLARFGTAILMGIDNLFSLPFSIIDASPFHTSLFVTNLASLRTGFIYHHLYDFGSTSIFLALGVPTWVPDSDGEKYNEKKVIEIGVSCDERIASGAYFARCFKELKRIYANPSVLEVPPENILNDNDVKCKHPRWIVK